jgi:hypothetical protein
VQLPSNGTWIITGGVDYYYYALSSTEMAAKEGGFVKGTEERAT